MARIRTVKPEFWASEQVMELSVLARLAFIGLWNFCDDAGVHTASAKRLKAEVFPSDEITIDRVSGLVDEMIRQGLVGEFEAGDERFWYVTGWRKHQKIEKPTFRHPKPPDSSMPRRNLAESSANRREVSDSTPSDSRHDVEPSPPEGNGLESIGLESIGLESIGLESIGMESKGKEGAGSPRGSRLPEDWYPSESDLEYARKHGVDAEREAEKFRNHWTAQPGAKGRKADWSATWRNWILKSVEFVSNRQARGSPPKPSTHTGFSTYDYKQDEMEWNANTN